MDSDEYTHVVLWLRRVDDVVLWLRRVDDDARPMLDDVLSCAERACFGYYGTTIYILAIMDGVDA
jgi:hypothetical protein